MAEQDGQADARCLAGECLPPSPSAHPRVLFGPNWLIIPERGLYTGAAIVGSGKTSACLHPFARQLLSWHATNPERRAAALVLEVKGGLLSRHPPDARRRGPRG